MKGYDGSVGVSVTSTSRFVFAAVKDKKKRREPSEVTIFPHCNNHTPKGLQDTTNINTLNATYFNMMDVRRRPGLRAAALTATVL